MDASALDSMNSELQKIMLDMQVRYLESLRENIDITLEQIKQLQNEKQ